MKKIILVASFLINYVSFGQTPFAEYRFNQDLTDRSANGNNLQPIDMGTTSFTYELGRSNVTGDYCIQLNGLVGLFATNYITNYNWQGTTLSFWIKSDFSSGTIIQGAYLGFGVYGVRDYMNNTSNVTTFFDGSTGNGQLSCTPFATLNNEWNHIAIKSSGSKTYYYYNGIVKDSVNETMYTSLFSTPQGILYIGELNNGTGKMSGCIDDIKIFNSALSTQQILDLYNEVLFTNQNNAGILELDKLNNLMVYPNPTTDVLTLNITDDSEIQILNTLGKVVYETVLSSSKTINIEHLESGIYTLKSGNNQVKFIKK